MWNSTFDYKQCYVNDCRMQMRPCKESGLMELHVINLALHSNRYKLISNLGGVVNNETSISSHGNVFVKQECQINKRLNYR